MFKNKKVVLEEAPLGYWEEKSYMIVIPENENKNPLFGLFERVADIKGVKVLEQRELTDEVPGYMKVLYEKEEYEVEFYPMHFKYDDFYLRSNYFYEPETIEKLKNASVALTVYMGFKKDAKKSYHLQLKIVEAIVPEMLAVLDESAEKLLPAPWVKMIVNSNIVPSSNDLYTVQAVTGKKEEVWLHTHGLCRCGVTELEVLESDQKNYQNHYNLVSTYANYLLDQKDNVSEELEGAYIGVLSNRQPVVVTCLSWTKALEKYPKLKLGNLKDREHGHNSKTSVIFIYKCEEDEENQVLSKVSIYNDLWGDNPIFFIHNEETARMRALAQEKFDILKEQFQNKENEIIIKIGLVTDEGDKENLEHIWFQLLEFKGDKFKGKLTQEPYNVSNMHEGDEAWFKKSDVTDWIIYAKEFAVTPESVYLLNRNEN